jgi:hypothetical protein
MMTENDTLAAQVGDLCAEACAELFAAYGVTLGPAGNGLTQSDAIVVSGVMGFVGARLRGTCLLASTDGPIAASCPANGSNRDWMGELTNQLVGRLKTKLLSRGVEVALTTPIVLSGARVQPVPRGPLLPSVFKSETGEVLVWVEAESARDVTLAAAHPSSDTGGEGDILFF